MGKRWALGHFLIQLAHARSLVPLSRWLVASWLPLLGAQLHRSALLASTEDSIPQDVARSADARALTLWPRTRRWARGAWRGVVGRVLTGRADWVLGATRPRTGRGVPFSVVLWVTSS